MYKNYTDMYIKKQTKIQNKTTKILTKIKIENKIY